MRSTRLSGMLAAIAMFAASACAGHQPTAGESVQTYTPCSGATTLTVDNRTRAEVEIVEMQTNSQGYTIAWARPGISTITIDPNRRATYGARVEGGHSFIAWEGERRSGSQVTLQRGCQKP